MNKTELIAAIAERADLSKQQTSHALTAFQNIVMEAMIKGDDIAMVGFGTFGLKERAARKGRNPQTGQEIDIPAAKIPAFKAGKALKESVNV